MKKQVLAKVLALALAMALAISLTACMANPNGPGAAAPSAAEASAVEASKPEASPPAESKPEYTGSPKLNTDVLSDLGLTYKEVVEKRGKLVDILPGPDVFKSYVFEKGYGSYCWENRHISLEGAIEKDGGLYFEKGPFPMPEIACQLITLSNINDLFLGLSEPIRAEEIEKIYGVKYVETTEDSDNYTRYEFQDGDMNIRIIAVNKGIIDKDAIVWIYDWNLVEGSQEPQ